MKVKVVYMCVVLVWATTPISIKWSNEGFGFLLSVSLRMAIALIIAAALLVLYRRRLFQKSNDWQAFVMGALSLYPTMLLVYWSAQYIPSGLVAVLLGMYPFFIGVFSIFILRENLFTLTRVLALLIAVCGLSLINYGQLGIGESAIYGVLGIVASSLIFAFATVSLKKIGAGVDPLRQLVGSLLFSAPLFVVTSLLSGTEWPDNISAGAWVSLSYLIVSASVLGGLGFFYIVTHCRVSTVGLVPLIAPMLAIIIGFVFAGEVLSWPSAIGSVCVLVSLVLYQGLWREFAGQYAWLNMKLRRVISRSAA